MARTKQPTRAGTGGHTSTSLSSAEAREGVSDSRLSSSPVAATGDNHADTAHDGDAEVDTANTTTTTTTTQKAQYTASERRRQTTLFLADAEQFAFDFGGEATRIAENVIEDAAEQRAARRAEELEVTTARVRATTADHASTTTAVHPLTVEEVSAYAAEALARAPQRFLTLPKAGAVRRRRETAEEGDTAAAAATATATVAEALPLFRAALRRYDEGLWRENKQHKEEEEQRRVQARKRQRA